MGNEWSNCLLTSDHKFPYWLIIGFETRVTRRKLLVEYELLILISSPIFREVRASQSLVFCVVFYILLFVFLSGFLWQLFCLSFDLGFLITPFVSSKLFLHHWLGSQHDRFPDTYLLLAEDFISQFAIVITAFLSHYKW